MKHLYFLFAGILSILTSVTSFAQAPGTFFPDQDCIGAIQVCKTQYSLTQRSGRGEVLDTLNRSEICLTSGERNSVWFRMDIRSSGLLGFNIIPQNPIADFDFLVFKMNGFTCDRLFEAPVFECNYYGINLPTPITGMNDNLFGLVNGVQTRLLQNSERKQVEQGDIYYLLVNNYNGNDPESFTVDFSLSTCTFLGCNTVSGRLYDDGNSDCNSDPDEISIPHRFVQLRKVDTPSEFSIAKSDENGYYELQTADTGRFSVHPYNLPRVLADSCISEANMIHFQGENQSISGIDVAVKKIADCSALTIENTVSRLRTCSSANLRTINICNEGSVAHDSVVVSFQYPPEIIPVGGAPLELVNGLYETTVRNLQAFECRTIQIFDSVSCEASFFGEGCVNAWLSTAGTCPPLFSQSRTLSLRDTCNPAYTAVVHNPLSSGSSEMINLVVTGISESSELTQIVRSNQLLNPGESITYEAPFDSLIYFSALIQESEIIATSGPRLCGIPDIAVTFRNWGLAKYDTASQSCENFLASYDPNDKTGYPGGIGEEHLILRQQEIRYRIRFQNTGNDTAYVVEIRDTLPDQLDITTIRPSNSSHRYRFQQLDNILKFKFEQIMLPDSATNPEGSNGYVDFYIKQKSSNPESYTITNSAAIYFDFNEPVVTEPWVYKISPIVTGLEKITSENTEISIFPNPANAGLSINSEKEITLLRLLDPSGRIILERNEVGKNIQISTEQIPSGLYFLEAQTKNQGRKTSKIIIQH